MIRFIKCYYDPHPCWINVDHIISLSLVFIIKENKNGPDYPMTLMERQSAALRIVLTNDRFHQMPFETVKLAQEYMDKLIEDLNSK